MSIQGALEVQMFKFSSGRVHVSTGQIHRDVSHPGPKKLKSPAERVGAGQFKVIWAEGTYWAIEWVMSTGTGMPRVMMAVLCQAAIILKTV